MTTLPYDANLQKGEQRFRSILCSVITPRMGCNLCQQRHITKVPSVSQLSSDSMQDYFARRLEINLQIPTCVYELVLLDVKFKYAVEIYLLYNGFSHKIRHVPQHIWLLPLVPKLRCMYVSSNATFRFSWA